MVFLFLDFLARWQNFTCYLSILTTHELWNGSNRLIKKAEVINSYIFVLLGKLWKAAASYFSECRFLSEIWPRSSPLAFHGSWTERGSFPPAPAHQGLTQPPAALLQLTPWPTWCTFLLVQGRPTHVGQPPRAQRMCPCLQIRPRSRLDLP